MHTEVVKGRDASGNPSLNWDLNALQGTGAILSTAEDLAKFVKTNLKENAVYDLPHRRANEHSPGMAYHADSPRENMVLDNGGTGGHRSCLVLNMDTKQGMVLLSNVSAFHTHSMNIDQLCFSLMKSIDH